MGYDAFISYSHDAERDLAAAIEAYRAQVDDQRPADTNALINGRPTPDNPKRGKLLLRSPRYWSIIDGTLVRESAEGLRSDDTRCQQ